MFALQLCKNICVVGLPVAYYNLSSFCIFKHLVMILHELDDDSDVVAVVLDGYHSHDVRSVLNTNICQ